jgi:hypothetical protein
MDITESKKMGMAMLAAVTTPIALAAKTVSTALIAMVCVPLSK